MPATGCCPAKHLPGPACPPPNRPPLHRSCWASSGRRWLRGRSSTTLIWRARCAGAPPPLLAAAGAAGGEWSGGSWAWPEQADGGMGAAGRGAWTPAGASSRLQPYSGRSPALSPADPQQPAPRPPGAGRARHARGAPAGGWAGGAREPARRGGPSTLHCRTGRRCSLAAAQPRRSPLQAPTRAPQRPTRPNPRFAGLYDTSSITGARRALRAAARSRLRRAAAVLRAVAGTRLASAERAACRGPPHPTTAARSSPPPAEGDGAAADASDSGSEGEGPAPRR